MNKSKSSNKKVNVYQIIILVFLVIYAISLFMPIAWGVMTSLKTEDDAFYDVLSLPKTWKFSNYPYVLRKFFVIVTNGEGVRVQSDMWGMLYNTIMYAVLGALAATIVPCVTGYLCSKFDFVLSKIVYAVVIVAMVLPIVGTYPAQIKLLVDLNLYDSFMGNVIQKANFKTMYFLVFFATFRGVDKGFAEAAEIDGASEWTIMTRIYMPLARTVFLTVVLLFFINFWNDYQTPLLYLPGHPTLAYGVYLLSNSDLNEFNTTPIRITVSVIMVIPIIILFIVFRNKLIGNLSMGGIKG